MLTDNQATLAWIIGACLFVYFLLIVWLGKRGAKYSRSMKGFSIAKGKVSPWLIGISFGATYSSANLFIGVPGWAYMYGTPVLWYTLGCFGITWVGLLLVTKKFWEQGQKNEGSLTLPQWLGNRYNSKALQVIVALLILFNIYYIVAQNVGLATMFETIIGIPYYWGILFGVTLTILYISMGGAYAQLITDGIQGIVMSVISVLLFLSLFWTIGGGWGTLGNLTGQLHNADPALTAYTAAGSPFYSGFAIMAIQWFLLSFVLLPQLMNKVLSVGKKEDLRKFTLSAGATLFFLSTFSVFAGLAARILIPGLTSSDSAVPAYVLEYFPTVLIVLIVMGIVSAILSTTDSLYLGMTASMGNDIYKVVVAPFLYKNKNVSAKQIDRKAVRVARIALFIIGLISLYMSFNRPESLSLLLQFGTSAIISGVVAPLTLSYFWKKANRVGAIASVIVGAACFMILTGFGVQDHVFTALLYSSMLGYGVMIAGSLWAEHVTSHRKVKQIEQQQVL